MSKVRSLVAAFAILWMLAGGLVPAPAMAQDPEVAQAAEMQQVQSPDEVQHHTELDGKVECNLSWWYHVWYFGGGDTKAIIVKSMSNGVPFSPGMSDAPDSRNQGGTNGFVPRNQYPADKQIGLPPIEEGEYIWVGQANGFVIFDLDGSRDFVQGVENWNGYVIMANQGQDKWFPASEQEIIEPELPENCDEPAVELLIVCVEGGSYLEATFINNGDIGDNDSKISWLIRGEPQDTITVEASSDVVVKIPVVEGEKFTFMATSPTGNFFFRQSVEINCVTPPAEPDATATCDCLNGLVVVTMTNPAPMDAAVVLLSASDGVVTETVTVAPGQLVTVTFPFTEDVPLTVTVSGDNFSKFLPINTNCLPEVPPIMEMGEMCKSTQVDHTEAYITAGSVAVVFTAVYNNPLTPQDESLQPTEVTLLPGESEVLRFANPPKFGDPASLLVIKNNINDQEIRVELVSCDQPTNLDPTDQPAQPTLPFRWRFYFPAMGK